MLIKLRIIKARARVKHISAHMEPFVWRKVAVPSVNVLLVVTSWNPSVAPTVSPTITSANCRRSLAQPTRQFTSSTEGSVVRLWSLYCKLQYVPQCWQKCQF